MYENFNRDIYEKIEYMPITFFSNALRVGIIGGGRGSYIKARSLSNNGAKVEVLSREFIDDFKNISATLIKREYDKKFIEDKHIVIIAISDEETIDNIISDCNSLAKIYINSSNFKNSMGVIPVKRDSRNILLSVNTKVGNPKGAVMIADKLAKEIAEYDDFIEFTAMIRNTIIMEKEEKLKMLSFINSEDFKYIFDKILRHSSSLPLV
ncbi:MAG: NAD(P)-dependent oxidoreductase, partial [Clostridium sp.]|nr:NAD(P)-dependent oxidoreductase [Clostridium sp.]